MATLSPGQSLATSFSMLIEASSVAVDRTEPEGIPAPGDNPWLYVAALEEALLFAAHDFASGVHRRLDRARWFVQPDDDPELLGAALGLPQVGETISIELYQGPLTRLVAEFGTSDQPIDEAVFEPFDLLRMRWYEGEIVVTIEGASFRFGSFWTDLKALIRPTILLPLLAAGAAVPPAGHLYNQHIQNVRLDQRIQGTACRSAVEFRLSAADLRQLGLEQMNWAARDLSDHERRLRLCRAQFALRLKGYPVGLLDGLMGKDTRRALRHFADENGMRGLPIDSVIVIDALAAQASLVVL